MRADAGICPLLYLSLIHISLRNLSALRELDMVVKGGYRIDKPQIKKMDEVERELDKFL